MSSTAQIFVLAYVREKVGEWARGDWATGGGISRAITQELCADDKLCMEIFEGVMLMCEEPLHEKEFFYKLRSLLDYIQVLMAREGTSTAEAWRCMKKNVQGILWYDYVAALRHQKEAIPAEAVVLLAEMRAQLRDV
jgi:hypothetical protein